SDRAWLGFSCSILFGIVAAGTGAYVFNAVDHSRFARSFFIAVLFGFVWKPVVEAIPAYVSNTTQAFINSTGKEIASKTQQASAKIQPEADAATVKPQIKAATDQAAKAVAVLPDVTNRSDTRQLVTD